MKSRSHDGLAVKGVLQAVTYYIFDVHVHVTVLTSEKVKNVNWNH